MLELYYNFFQKYCDQNKFEELEMDTDSLYLALAENNFPDCIKQDMVDEWSLIRREDCSDELAWRTFSHIIVVLITRSLINGSLVCSKMNLELPK